MDDQDSVRGQQQISAARTAVEILEYTGEEGTLVNALKPLWKIVRHCHFSLFFLKILLNVFMIMNT